MFGQIIKKLKINKKNDMQSGLGWEKLFLNLKFLKMIYTKLIPKTF